MDRRDFIKSSSLAAAALLGLPARGGPSLPRALIPLDKGFTPEQLVALRLRGQRRIYSGVNRFALGMPVGGITAGQLYLLGDGSLGGFHIDGRLNFTGWGENCYRIREPERNLKQGFTIRADQATLPLTDPEHGGPFDRIRFIGEYPVAEVTYSGAAPPHLEISLRACSPFIPLNAKDSALPCTILRYTVRN